MKERRGENNGKKTKHNKTKSLPLLPKTAAILNTNVMCHRKRITMMHGL